MRLSCAFRRSVSLVVIFVCAPSLSLAPEPLPAPPRNPPLSPVTLHYGVEWRLIRAGNASLLWAPPESPGQPRWRADLHLESVGLVSRLYKVDNNYSVWFDADFCASKTFMEANEGKKHRETTVTFQQPPGKAAYVERDLLKDEVVNTKEIDVPACVHDVIAALARLRTMDLQIGQSLEMPISDGKKMVSARVEVQKLEKVRTPLGEYQAIRCEAFLFNQVLYRRSGRLYVWLTADERRLPVQIRVRLRFYIGTITLQLEKEEIA